MAFRSFVRSLHDKSEAFWQRGGERRALELFHEMAGRVPAYVKFLKKHKVQPALVRSARDLAKVPETNKKNYTAAYTLAERSFDGDIGAYKILAASSGTTGAPTLWPRGAEQESEATQIHSVLFNELYEVDRYKTLIIIGFPMGVYVSGIATALPTYFASLAHPNIAIITAGNSKENILSVINKVQNLYEQIILVGHPFFVKDVIESGKRVKVLWGKTKLRAFFCSEGFNEEWRGYLASLVPRGSRTRDFFNTYGSSELLLMGYETPESIMAKQYLESHEAVQEALLGRVGPFSLFQYNPAIRYMETNEKSELIFTARAGIPLCRYNLKDAGALLPRSDMVSATDHVVKGWRPWHLPYVALFGRSDHTLVFYAANIYPEHINAALNHTPFLKKITGKFTMEKNYTDNMDQKLIIHVELQEGVRGNISFARTIERRVVDTLVRLNMEYLDASTRLGKDMRPRILLHKYRDTKFFSAALKPRYIAS